MLNKPLAPGIGEVPEAQCPLSMTGRGAGKDPDREVPVVVLVLLL